jgi:hypothetical protein
MTTLVQDPRLIWVDAMWIDAKGTLWIPWPQLNRGASLVSLLPLVLAGLRAWLTKDRYNKGTSRIVKSLYVSLPQVVGQSIDDVQGLIGAGVHDRHWHRSLAHRPCLSDSDVDLQSFDRVAKWDDPQNSFTVGSTTVQRYSHKEHLTIHCPSQPIPPSYSIPLFQSPSNSNCLPPLFFPNNVLLLTHITQPTPHSNLFLTRISPQPSQSLHQGLAGQVHQFC